MKRIFLSVFIAIAVHGLLLSAGFNLPRGSVGLPQIPDRLTVVMAPAPLPKKASEAEPMPVRKRLPAPLPPPAPELMAKTGVARIPDELPKEIPDNVPAPPILQPKPKKSLKAQTYQLRPPELEQAAQPTVQSQFEASPPKPDTTPLPTASADRAATAERSPNNLTTVAAVRKPREVVPDRPAIPLLKQNPPPVYPGSARRRGYQGSVVLKVLVGVNGSVQQVEIEQSCGYAVLDRTALSAVRGWQFEPGIRDGRKIKMWVKVPVRFELKN